jgi:Zn-dependent protease
MTCPQCGVELPPNLLVCPFCHALVHAAELKNLAAQAEGATAAGNYSEALANWRRALELLPPASAQYGVINIKINDLVQRLESPIQPGLTKNPKWANKGGVIGGIGSLAIFFLSKAKLLLLGLTKASTLLSMLLTIAVYTRAMGWQFAVGLVLSIYVHEMGHVFQLRRYGLNATAPMFIPWIGALIRLKQYPASPHEEARVGLAGPVWGLAAAGFCYALYLGIGTPVLAAVAQVGAWINLFNLTPVWQLDGSHAFKALSRLERIGIAAIMFGMWYVTDEGLLLLLMIVAAFRCFEKRLPEKRDLPIFTEFAFLVVTLALLTKIEVNTERKQPMIESVPLTSTAAVAESRMFAEARPVFAPAYGRPTGTSLPPR